MLWMCALGCSLEREPSEQGRSGLGGLPPDASADSGSDAGRPAMADGGDGAAAPPDDAAPDPEGCREADCVAGDCGNALLDDDENCDDTSAWPCPGDCDDGDPCTVDRMEGSADRCDAVCVHEPVSQALSGDGCCPPGASANADDDCEAACGNDVLEGAETCEPRVAPGCALDCSDGDPCTRDFRRGAPIRCDVTCDHSPVTLPLDGDACCPPGAHADNDDDCASTCGNGIVESAGGELCEPGSALPCPESCSDGNPCTLDVTIGSAETCDVRCDHPPVTEAVDGDACCPPGATSETDRDCSPTCGDGVLDAGETCEPGSSPGSETDCPASCDDDDPCTTDLMTGTPAQCNVVCTHVPITQPNSGDRCCPEGADANNDGDCEPRCGNGAIEEGETCEPGTDNDCPADCDDGEVCTRDERTGSVEQCNVACSHAPITTPHDGDLCCPEGANGATDRDCVSVCGNGVREPGEACDDGDRNGDAGRCNERCSGQVPSFSEIYAEILAPSCGPCHTLQSRGGLDLSNEAVARAELIGAPASGCGDETLVVPGDPDASLLIKKTDPALALPASCPDSSAGSHLLGPTPLAQLRAWISALD